MDSKSRKVLKTVKARETSDGAGVKLKRSLGTQELEILDPFLLLDEFKSDVATDYIAGFPDHPHRGFETVTYMLAGSMQHGDHKGNSGNLVAGSVQWMTAGRGIIHSEMPKQKDGLLWGFQLWINLPAADKMCEPRYQEVPPEEIPEVEPEDGQKIRVIAGAAGGVQGVVRGIATEPLYLDVTLPARSRFEQKVAPEHNMFAYVFAGEGNFGVTESEPGQPVGVHNLAMFSQGDSVTVATTDAAVRFLLLAARPLREPVARHGPFVMNTREEIMQAVQDFREGNFLD